jgi:hypothetical protein
MSASKFWTETMIELPGVREDGMLGRNGQRKPGTTRGSPRRSRTAKALRISCHAVKSRCARGWGGWGRLSDDGSRQHNSGQSEDPWGGGRPILHGGAPSSARPDTARDYRRATRCAKGGRKLNINKCMPGAGLSWLMCGKAPPDMPAFQPYRGKPAVRNDREGRGNDGIIRSPGSRLDSTRLRDEAGQPPHLLGHRRQFLHGGSSAQIQADGCASSICRSAGTDFDHGTPIG